METVPPSETVAVSSHANGGQPDAVNVLLSISNTIKYASLLVAKARKIRNDVKKYCKTLCRFMIVILADCV